VEEFRTHPIYIGIADIGSILLPSLYVHAKIGVRYCLTEDIAPTRVILPILNIPKRLFCAELHQESKAAFRLMTGTLIQRMLIGEGLGRRNNKGHQLH
jgi:hypothetical protein